MATIANFDNFWGAAITPDAAVYALQSVEIRENQVLREDSGGSYWNTPSSYEGDYLLVPPGGKEARTARFIVKMSRNPLGAGEDSGVDDLSGRLTIIPRYLILPS
jgi:hypothetical protein